MYFERIVAKNEYDKIITKKFLINISLYMLKRIQMGIFYILWENLIIETLKYGINIYF